MKGLGIAVLCVVSLSVLLVGVVPAVSLLLGLGIDIPRSKTVVFVYSRPWLPLVASLLLLTLFGWGIWTLTRG